MSGLSYLTERAKEYVQACTGEFSSASLAKDIGVVDAETRDSIMSDLCAMKLCEATGRRNGEYRKIDSEAPEIDWMGASMECFPLRLPFGLDRMARINHGGLVFVGGETNGGKSYFSMLISHMNLAQNGGRHRTVRFLNSETVAPVIKENALRINPDTSSWHGLDIRSRTKDFHTVLNKDGLTVIDYLHLNDKFYDVGTCLEKMIDPENIGTGAVIVFMQKKKGAKLALGGTFTQHKPALALSLNELHGVNSVKIDKLKMPTKHPNPEGVELDFRFNGVGGFDVISNWRYLTEKNREELWKQYERERALSRVSHNYGDF